MDAIISEVQSAKKCFYCFKFVALDLAWRWNISFTLSPVGQIEDINIMQNEIYLLRSNKMPAYIRTFLFRACKKGGNCSCSLVEDSNLYR